MEDDDNERTSRSTFLEHRFHPQFAMIFKRQKSKKKKSVDVTFVVIIAICQSRILNIYAHFLSEHGVLIVMFVRETFFCCPWSKVRLNKMFLTLEVHVNWSRENGLVNFIFRRIFYMVLSRVLCCSSKSSAKPTQTFSMQILNVFARLLSQNSSWWKAHVVNHANLLLLASNPQLPFQPSTTSLTKLQKLTSFITFF